MSDRSQPKSQSTQLFLSLLFGPLGLVYSSLAGGVVLALAALVLAKDFGAGYGIAFAWLTSVAAGAFSVRHWNRRAASHAQADRSAHAVGPDAPSPARE